MKFILLSLLLAFPSFGYVSTDAADRINKADRIHSVLRVGNELYQAAQWGAKGTYDVAVQGGAVGSYSLKFQGGDLKLPDNAIIVDCFYDVVTAMASTGGTGTIALTAESAADLVAAVDADTVSGQVACGGPDGTEAEYVKLSADRTITATVATAALTAGKINVYLQYVLSE